MQTWDVGTMRAPKDLRAAAVECFDYVPAEDFHLIFDSIRKGCPIPTTGNPASTL